MKFNALVLASVFAFSGVAFAEGAEKAAQATEVKKEEITKTVEKKATAKKSMKKKDKKAEEAPSAN